MGATAHSMRLTSLNWGDLTDSNRSTLYIDGARAEILNMYSRRGHSVFRYDRDTLVRKDFHVFDTFSQYETSDQQNPNMQAMIDYLNGLDTRDIIVVLTQDAISCDDALRTALSRFGLPSNAGILCSSARNSFAMVGQLGLAAGTAPYAYRVGASCTLDTIVGYGTVVPDTAHVASTLRVKAPLAGTQQIYTTKEVGELKLNTLQLKNTKLYAGRTYYVKVTFRTRGDGDSTPSHCSSVGFIANWGGSNNWEHHILYMHTSAKAYAERGRLVTWTYPFTMDSDVQPAGTALYFIIDYAWANGYDNQTIDLYYAKYWDSEGNVYNEFGNEGGGQVEVALYDGMYSTISGRKYMRVEKDGKVAYAQGHQFPRYEELNGSMMKVTHEAFASYGGSAYIYRHD